MRTKHALLGAASVALMMSGATFSDPAMAGTDRSHVRHGDPDLYLTSMTTISDGLGATGSGSTPLDTVTMMRDDLSDSGGGHLAPMTVISADTTDPTSAGAAGHNAPS